MNQISYEQYQDNEPLISTDSEGYITSQQYFTANEEKDVDDGISNLPLAYEQDMPRHHEQRTPGEIVLVMQITVCVIIAVTAYILKSCGGDFYNELRNYYFDNMNNNIIINTNNDNNISYINELLNNALK